MLRLPIILLIAFALMGCGMNRTDKDNAVNQEPETGVDTDTVNEPENNDVSNNANVDQNTTTDYKLELADQAAEQVAEMEEVESANVLVTDTNAYVAVELKEGVEGNEQTENKIADLVREKNADFKNVYVSMNPDFVKQMTDYGDKIRAGEPVEGFFTEFSDAVRRVFPDAH